MVVACVICALNLSKEPKYSSMAGEVAVGLVAAVWGEVLPEDRVQHVARDVEGQRLFEADDGPEVVLVAGRGELLERRVRTGHVGGVVLVVVQLEDFPRDVRLEGPEVVRKIWERVHGHLSASW